VLVASLALTLLLALAAWTPAAGAKPVKYKWSITGSLRSDWTEAKDPDLPCGGVGTGSVTSTFTGKPRGFFRVGLRDRFGVPFDKWDPAVPLSGTITATDDTVQNADPSVGCTPLDKSGCGTFALRGAKLSLESPNSRDAKDWGISAENLADALPKSPTPCKRGLFEDFSMFNDKPVKPHPLTTRLRSHRQLLRGKSFSKTVTDTRTDKEDNITMRTTRKVTLKFKRKK
jgi:hypothetical protein